MIFCIQTHSSDTNIINFNKKEIIAHGNFKKILKNPFIFVNFAQ